MKVFDDLTTGLEVGKLGLDFHLTSDRKLSDLKGSPILLVFWKTL
jgi:hypothetical protein